jgi:hypothetical protein
MASYTHSIDGIISSLAVALCVCVVTLLAIGKPHTLQQYRVRISKLLLVLPRAQEEQASPITSSVCTLPAAHAHYCSKYSFDHSYFTS